MLIDSEPREISVSELTGHIKAILEGTFPKICVAGEISDLTRPRSGHLYFTLKDEHAQIRGVMWRGTAERSKTKLQEGDSVLCFGDVEVYTPRGTYQLIVRKVQPQGLGALQQAFQKLQAKLNAEGLFAAERKRRLPKFPQRIGIITSPSGAAVHDFLKAAAGRWMGVEITVIPAQVQGDGAARSIVGAIHDAHKLRPKLDVLVVSRGGGSLEDLWCFNEEAVVRAVAASRIPTVSAVGHEIDVTLCDMAADVRALTPTDGASQVIPDASKLNQSVSDLRRRIDGSIRSLIAYRRKETESYQSRSIMRKPHEIIQSRYRRLDELDGRGRRAMNSKLRLARASMATTAASLSALSPLNVLSRGYSVTLDAQGNAINSANDINNGDVIRTKLNDGEIESVVRDKT
jgi:exodeoxyribonuclease VII large subunit